MNTNLFIRTVWVFAIVITLIPITLFFCNVGTGSFSSDPTIWGQFGDYFGGILNPLFAVMNLIVLTYLTLLVMRNDLAMRETLEQQEQNRFQALHTAEQQRQTVMIREMSRPYGSLFIYSSPDFKITIRNDGLGPMIIREFAVELSDGASYTDFYHAMYQFIPKTARFNSFEVDDGESVVGKDQEITLFGLDFTQAALTQEYKKAILSRLAQCRLRIKYFNLFNDEIATIVQHIKFTDFS